MTTGNHDFRKNESENFGHGYLATPMVLMRRAKLVFQAGHFAGI
jgi:hypothetical protein